MNNQIKVEMIRLEDIHPYENNPRFNEGAVAGVANSIERFGFKVPVIVDRNNVLIAGHTRVKAAERLGMVEVPAVRADDLNQQEVDAFRLADNKVAEASEWDIKTLQEELSRLTEFDMAGFGFDLDFEMPEFVEIEEDDWELEPAPDPQSKLGQVYQLGKHRLMCGDSTNLKDVQKLVDGQQVDLLLTDPPYNVDYEGTAGKIQNDNMADAQFRQFLVSAYASANNVMKPGAAFYIWHADCEGFNFRGAARDVGWTVRQCLIWVKSSLVLGRQDYHWIHEPCLYGWKDGAAHYFIDDRTQTTVIEDQKRDFSKMKKEEMKQLLEEIYSDKEITTIIREAKPARNDMHPTMKPLKLMGRLIKNSSKKNEKVLDLFGGSGSTLMACEQLERTCYTMEYDPRFVDVIIERWEAYTGEKAVLIEGE